MDIHVTRRVLDQMETAARSAFPREACGILLGEGERITDFREAQNVHPTPETHFEIDPQTLIDAHRCARAGGAQVIGYFHSHPVGPARPSATDAALASAVSTNWGSIWAIYGTVQGETGAEMSVRFFLLGEGGFVELSMSSIES